MKKFISHLCNYSPLIGKFQTMQIMNENKTIVATFGFNMTGFTPNFDLKNGNNVIYDFRESSATKQFSEFKKAIKNGFVNIDKTLYN